MKAKSYAVRFTLFLLVLIAIVGMAYGTYEIFFRQEVSDPNGTYLTFLGCPFFLISLRSAWRARVSNG